jgi:PPM family protein phosphatase
MTVSVASHMGRRSSQQDRAVAFSMILPNGRTAEILMVFDGAGGHKGGEVAATLGASVTSSVLNSALVASDPIRVESLFSLIPKALRAAHRSILKLASQDESLAGMASTAVVAVVLEDYAVTAWAGDSRIYLYRRGRMTLLSRDHSVPQGLVRAGELEPDKARYHPEGNIITSCLGHPSKLLIETRIAALSSGSALILGSDGMTEVLTGQEIAGVLESTRSPPAGKSPADEIVTAAIGAGSRDNTTSVVYRHAAQGTGGWRGSQTIVDGFEEDFSNLLYDATRKEASS